MKKVFLILALILGSWSIDADAKVRTGQSDAPAAVVDVDHGGDSPGYRGSQIGGAIPGVLNFNTGKTSLYPFVGKGDSGTAPQTYIPVVMYGDFSGASGGGGSSDSVLVWLTSAELLRWAQTFGYNDTSKLTTAELEQLADSIGRAVHRYDTGGGSGGGSATSAAVVTGHATETTARAIDSSIRSRDTFTTILTTATLNDLAETISIKDTSPVRTDVTGNFLGGAHANDLGVPMFVWSQSDNEWIPLVSRADAINGASSQGIVALGFGTFSGVHYSLPVELAEKNFQTLDPSQWPVLNVSLQKSDTILTVNVKADTITVIPKGASLKQTTGTDTLGSTFRIFNGFSDTFALVEIWSDTDIIFYVAPKGNIQTETLTAQKTGGYITSKQSFIFTDGDSVAVRTKASGVSSGGDFTVTLWKW